MKGNNIMEKKPVIGIIGRSFIVDDESVICVNEDYRLAVVKAGGVPVVLIPPNYLKYGITQPRDAGRLTDGEKENLYAVLRGCDGFLMTGGSRWYDFDEIVCRYAIDNDIPILGICLGMQILANIDNFCGDIRSDKTIKNDTSINHCQEKVDYVHKVRINDGKLYDILGEREILVNSRHNYHVTEKDWFNVDAYSEDGLIEALSIPNMKFALGVQWHPENMVFYDSIMLKIFESFINSCE